jgi:hypothetical protein
MEKKRSDRGEKEWISPTTATEDPKYGKTNQMAPLNKACTWKKSKLNNEGI